MRSRIAVASLIVSLAGAGSVVSLGASERNGLPAYTDGYQRWPRINKRPFSTPGAHTGVKNVYTSKPRGRDRLFPDGTVIVKSIAAPRAKGLPAQVAVMRKVRGRWQWVEYSLEGRRYAVLAKGGLCTSCHMQARANDWVFTKR